MLNQNWKIISVFFINVKVKFSYFEKGPLGHEMKKNQNLAFHACDICDKKLGNSKCWSDSICEFDLCYECMNKY